MGRIVDSAISGDMSGLLDNLYMILVIMAVHTTSSLFHNYFKGRFAEYALFDLRERTAKHIGKLSMPCIDKHHSGELISSLTNDIMVVQNFLQNNLGNILVEPMLFIISLFYLCSISWNLTLFSVSIAPILMFLVIKMSKPIERLTGEQQEFLSEVNTTAQDSISGLDVVKSFNLENTMEEKFSYRVDRAVSRGLEIALTQAILNPIGTIMGMSPFILTFLYGGYLVINGAFSFGNLISFIQVLNYVVNPLTSFPRLLSTLRSAVSALSRIFDVWELELEREDGSIFPRREGVPVISFKDVSFSYNTSGEVVSGLNLEVKNGETIGIVGPSGSGKSTIVKLILGFYNPTKGDIYLYGERLMDWKLDSARSLISLVSQDTYLFPESIYNNIAFGKKNATRDEVINASRLAGIHEFIESLPQGYDTFVGERGVRLSGGERQRIAIARAFLKDTPILILDEPTSSLDADSEKRIQESLEKLMAGRTTIVIAHRLSTVMMSDRIIVMNQGKIIDVGTHNELLERDSLYRQLYMNQINESKQEDVRR